MIFFIFLLCMLECIFGQCMVKWKKERDENSLIKMNGSNV